MVNIVENNPVQAVSLHPFRIIIPALEKLPAILIEIENPLSYPVSTFFSIQFCGRQPGLRSRSCRKIINQYENIRTGGEQAFYKVSAYKSAGTGN
jgi:hypothetical protein